MYRKYFKFIIVSSIILIVVGYIQNISSTEKKDIAPDFSAEDINGKIFNVGESTGKPVVIQFMRVYCHGGLREETKEQFKQLSKLHNRYKNEIIFVTITISSCKTSDLKEIAKEFGIKWTFINDYSDYNLDIIEKYSKYLKNLSDPALIFINRKKEIVTTTNFCDDKKLDEYINSIIEVNKRLPVKSKGKNKK